MNAVMDQSLRNSDIYRLKEMLDELVASLRALLELLQPHQPLAHVSLKFREGFELTRLLGEIIIERRKIASLHGDEGHLDLADLTF